MFKGYMVKTTYEAGTHPTPNKKTRLLAGGTVASLLLAAAFAGGRFSGPDTADQQSRQALAAAQAANRTAEMANAQLRTQLKQLEGQLAQAKNNPAATAELSRL